MTHFFQQSIEKQLHEHRRPSFDIGGHNFGEAGFCVVAKYLRGVTGLGAPEFGKLIGVNRIAIYKTESKDSVSFNVVGAYCKLFDLTPLISLNLKTEGKHHTGVTQQYTTESIPQFLNRVRAGRPAYTFSKSVGLSHSTLSTYFNGTAHPKLSTLDLIAESFGATLTLSLIDVKSPTNFVSITYPRNTTESV